VKFLVASVFGQKPVKFEFSSILRIAHVHGLGLGLMAYCLGLGLT